MDQLTGAGAVVDPTLAHYHGMRGVEIYPNTSTLAEGHNTTNLRCVQPCLYTSGRATPLSGPGADHR